MKKLPILLFAILFLVSACTSAVRGVPLYPEDAAAVTFPVTGGEQIAAKINTTVPLKSRPEKPRQEGLRYRSKFMPATFRMRPRFPKNR